jgi:phage terminase large subunit GpA-like protein
MNAILDPDIRLLIFLKCTQLGWSDAVINNIIGYYIDIEPRPMLLVVPSENDAKGYSKKKIAPMVESCAVLRDRVRKATARRAGNTLTLKEFDGGFLKITGANSGKGLRSDPIPVLLMDEVDGYPSDVDGEGDPVDIAMRRTDTFDDAKVLLGSTPAKPKGFSRVEAEFLRSDRRRYHVPCPFCEFMQPLRWRRVDEKTGELIEYHLVYERDSGGEVIPASVKYRCVQCKRLIDEASKGLMMAAGKWIAEFPERTTIRGYHMNALYSPWRNLWIDLAQEWVAAHNNPEKMKTFVNLRLGETWEEAGDTYNASALADRLEVYKPEDQGDFVPAGVVVLVASVDVQGNRLEAQIVGFGAGEEQWLIAYEHFFGTPDDPDTTMWEELDEFLQRPRQHAMGFDMRPAITLVDSSAYSESVYQYVKPRQHAGRRVYAIKGVDHLSRPGIVKEGSTKKAAIRLWIVGTFVAKDRIFARMKIKPNEGNPVPGLMHFPNWTTPEYLDQLTAEKKITVRDKRTKTSKIVWVRTGRNEALDLTVYAHAGLAILRQHIDRATYADLDKLAAEIAKTGKIEPPKRQGWRMRPIFSKRP